jgi:hypothetical protein
MKEVFIDENTKTNIKVDDIVEGGKDHIILK